MYGEIVTLTDMGHIKEIQYLSKMNTQARIKKLDKHRYMVLETGEIKEYSHIENRSESENSLYQTFKKLRYLINNNFYGKPNELFLTLTYAENMRDRERLYDDVRKFLMRFRYKYGKNLDYLNIVEPQARGAWHCHLLLRFNDLKKVYIPNEEIRNIWGHGFVKVNRLNNVDNIGAYLSAYLADVELTDDTVSVALMENKKIVKKKVGNEEKAFIKGGRLKYYPAGMNLFRKSKGIKYPDREKMRYEKAKKRVGSLQPTHFSENEIKLSDDDSINIIFQEYNSKRL